MTYRALIVDDESAACNRLDRMLARIQAPFEIIGKAADGFDALRIINDSKPDVVFFDLELPGINGIEMLRHCTCDPYIIFTTANDRYAIEAFEAKTISYLVKPISELRLLTAVEKLLKMAPLPAESLASMLKPVVPLAVSQLPFLPVKNGNVIYLVPKESIVWICSEGKYTIIATKEKRYISNYSMTELEERLGSPFFLRVHRSYIVNLKHIVEMRKIGAGKMKLITRTLADEDIVVSKNYYNNLKERLVID